MGPSLPLSATHRQIGPESNSIDGNIWFIKVFIKRALPESARHEDPFAAKKNASD